MEEENGCKKDYINNLMQTYFPEISSLEDSTQTVIQTIFEWSVSNFEKRLKLYCSAAPRHDEEELRRYMQTSDIQENYLMQIFKGRQIIGTGAVHTQYSNSPHRSQPIQPANLPPNQVLQPPVNGPMIGWHQGHTHVMPAFNHANQLINVVPNRQAPMVFPQKVIPKESLTASILAKVSLEEQKQMLGEALYPRIQMMYPELAGKITGMLLEIDNMELLHMVESNDALKSKTDLRERDQKKDSRRPVDLSSLGDPTRSMQAPADKALGVAEAHKPPHHDKAEEAVAVLQAHQAKEAAAAIKKE